MPRKKITHPPKALNVKAVDSADYQEQQQSPTSSNQHLFHESRLQQSTLTPWIKAPAINTYSMNQGSSNQHSLHESKARQSCTHDCRDDQLTESHWTANFFPHTPSISIQIYCPNIPYSSNGYFISFTVQRLYILFPLLSLSLILNVSLPFLVAPYLYRADYL